MKALIAMSGGVDSSVAALLTKEQGYDCIGCTMKLYSPEDLGQETESGCCSLDDVEDARSVCFRLGIPYYVFNFKDDFREKVIDPFVRSYLSGETPNPCIECNRRLKFERLYERAKVLGCDKIVTGHYARIEEKDGQWYLKKALDPEKDQSYVLYSLTQEQLASTLFPLGALSKSEARKTAEEHGFRNADKPDSQDICFVPDGDYAAVIEQYTGKASVPGDFLDTEGHKLGTHKGIIHYTVGQRRGLGLASTEPWYVVRIDPDKNAVILGRSGDLFSREVRVRAFHWISGKTPEAPIRCRAKIRYRHKEQDAAAIPLPGGEVLLRFDEPQRAATPGQAAVLYDGEICLGGGVIVSSS